VIETDRETVWKVVSDPDRIATRQIGRTLTDTLKNLKAQVES
jgi:hypothetical protein